MTKENTNLAALEKVLPAPLSATGRASEKSLKSVETALGRLPSDYKEFVHRYGCGCIDGFLWIFVPETRNENLRLETQALRQLENLRSAGSAVFGQEFPFELIPGSEEVMPCGVTDNGDFLLWKKEGGPDSWTIIVVDSRLSLISEHKLGLIAFLEAVLTRKLREGIFPSDFPSTAVTFKPAGRL